MTTFSRAQFSAASGVISPLLFRRPDYVRTKTGLAQALGFLPLRQGGFTRHPGSWYHGRTRGDAPARLIAFEFAADDAMQVEFTEGKARFWRYGQPVLVAGVPYEIDTPYLASDLPNLVWQQSADVIYLADGRQKVQRLARSALDSWTIEPATFELGPFRPQNLDEALELGFTGDPEKDGIIGITTTGWDLFVAAHVGALLQVEPVDQTAVRPWGASQSASVGDYFRANGNTYRLESGTGTGGIAPSHSEGTVLYDDVEGPSARRWTFVDDGTGVLEITNVIDAQNAEAVVRKRLPQTLMTDFTYRWSEGAWNDLYGYPACITLFDDRLTAAATRSDPRTIWFSGVGAYTDFEPGVEADESFSFAIAGKASLNRILWLSPGRNALQVGALGEENSSRSTAQTQVIGPETTRFTFDSQIGSHATAPISPEGAAIFIAKDRQRLFQIAYSLERDANRAVELSLPANHLGAVGFEEVVWQSSPDRLAWIRRGDGTLAAMMFDADEEVLGWSELSLAGGFVESLCVTPNEDSTADILTLAVRRDIEGETRRHIESLAVTRGQLIGAMDLWEVNHAYAASRFAPGAPADTFSLPHLAGETVYAWTELGQYGPLTVAADGSVTLDDAVSHAIIGLFDASHQAESLDLLSAAPDGDTMGRRKKLTPGTGIALHRTAQALVSVVEREFAQPERETRAEQLVPIPVAGALTAAHSGMARLKLGSGGCDEVSLRFRPFGLAPMTVLAFNPPVEDRGR